ncbi:MAG: GAF domain-containing protein [Alphaproteobacteria bacterium]|nr:GAF domain-containing protein [Alphaproteobacteria bacterium]
MEKPEQLKKWIRTLEKFNSSLIELFDVAEKDVLSKTYLRDVVQKLVDILQVKYGALGLLGESQRFVNFIHVGISDEKATEIAHLPEGKGLLGVVITENKTLNVEDMSKDPRRYGFPPHHPQMKSLLAAPVSYNDLVFGRIYLSDKRSGEAFTKQDEKLLSGFAHLLGLMIRNRNESERISLARQAGKAEVSVSILHNMGNMLNSLNVSAQMVREKAHQLNIEDLTTINTFLQTHKNELGPFFSENQKGKHFVDYLISFAERLANAKTGLLSEIITLNENIEHIRNTVTMYHSMDKKIPLIEPILIGKTFETILSLHEESLVKNAIFTEINNDITFPIMLDRMKLEQILINLVSNAIDALIRSKNSEKQLILSVFSEKDDMISIQITDNGVGISAENLIRIFNFGFTTKTEGGGFGLHASALAALEMGGNLIATSEGPDKGSTFTLKLPRSREKIS